MRALARAGAPQRLCHTGQHYDAELAADVERDVGLPEADVRLRIGSGTHAEQTAKVMVGVEALSRAERPAIVVVYGDVNSTLGAALGATRAGVEVAHVEAGLRSGDRTMAEEINRRLVDHVAALLFCTDDAAAGNLRAEGLGERDIRVVGNVMSDALLWAIAAGPASGTTHPRRRIGLEGADYALVTLHRPESVERPEILAALVEAVCALAHRLRVVFPQHPRTRTRLEASGGLAALEGAGVRLVPPLVPRDVALLLDGARLVVTDSGGLQDECAVLGVPCVTARTSTERPATVACGSNRVAGTSREGLERAVEAALAGPPRVASRPPLWDGRVAERIAEVLARRAR